ncbi:MAG: hypothetical protein OHK93_003865 [Ramalina farinacea]|uniref:Uncharacterized protein n=1 Tax=Ramalina farinacea TaxID=258253 RepID=A0AA43QFN0_9LECA|nr:hypothetical protein [Ramalina farinacea]
MAPSRQPLQQLSQTSKSANLPDPKATNKPKPNRLAPQNQENKVHKTLPANKPTQIKAFLPDQFRRGLKALGEDPAIQPPTASPQLWQNKHDIDNEKSKANVELWDWHRFSVIEGWQLLKERQQMINNWKASDSLSAMNAKLLKKFEELQINTARQVWLPVHKGRCKIEADIKRWNDSPMPLTEQAQHSLDRLNGNLDRARSAELELYTTYKSIIGPLVEAEKLAKRRDEEEMDRMVKDAYQAILAAEAQSTDNQSP